MRSLVKLAAVVVGLLLTVAAQSQEGFPLDGTWRGEWGPDGGKSTVVIVMKWDGTNVNGMINPGPNVVRFSGPVLEPRDWSVRIEAQSRDGQPIVIAGKAITSRIETMSVVQLKIGMRIRLMPGARRLMTVTIILNAAIIEATPRTCSPTSQKSTFRPGFHASVVSGA